MTNKSTPSDQWGELNKILQNSRYINMGMIAVSLVVSIMLAWQLLKPPVVIKESPQGREHYSSSYKQVTVTNDDAKKFISKFVKARYIWKQFEPEQIAREIQPLVTESFVVLLGKSLQAEKKKMIKVKSIEQNVTNIVIEIAKGKAVATFDKIIRVNKVPLIAPTQISLNIIKGKANRWNPLGLYVHGIVEHSEK